MGEELVLLCGMNLPVILGAIRRFGGLAVSSGGGIACGVKLGKNCVLCNRGRVRELDKCVDSAVVAGYLDAVGTFVRDGSDDTRSATWARRVTVELIGNSCNEFKLVQGCCGGAGESRGLLGVREGGKYYY